MPRDDAARDDRHDERLTVISVQLQELIRGFNAVRDVELKELRLQDSQIARALNEVSEALAVMSRQMFQVEKELQTDSAGEGLRSRLRLAEVKIATLEKSAEILESRRWEMRLALLGNFIAIALAIVSIVFARK